MIDAIELQRDLYRSQQQRIRELLQAPSPAFRRYQARYAAATRSFRAVTSPRALHQRIAASDVVHVGDYHTLAQAQTTFLELVMAARRSGRRVVLAMEFVEGARQSVLDAWLRGRVTDAAFLKGIKHPYRGAFDTWPHFAPIFRYAREHGLEVLAIDSHPPGRNSLGRRDAYAADRIASALRSAGDAPLVLCLMGQYHVAPAHLPRAVERACARPLRQLVVYQNAEGAFWKLLKTSTPPAGAVVELSEREWCVFSASPLLCQQSFLDYVEAETGDAPVSEQKRGPTFARIARSLAAYAGVSGASALADVKIIGPAQLPELSALLERSGMTTTERRAIARHIRSRESAWIPRARAVYLAQASLNHLAEEATHALRHALVGQAMTRSLPVVDAFFARALEEALGFFGSRLVNPARAVVDLATWQSHFADTRSPNHATAAFVLAMSSAPLDTLKSLVPPANSPLFLDVSHAVGYLLGAAMADAHARGRLSTREGRAIFRERWRHPRLRYAELRDRFAAPVRQN